MDASENLTYRQLLTRDLAEAEDFRRACQLREQQLQNMAGNSQSDARWQQSQGITALVVQRPFLRAQLQAMLELDLTEQQQGLAYLQEILRRQLNDEAVTSSQPRCEATLLPAFEQLYHEYAAHYIDAYLAYQRASHEFRKWLPRGVKYLHALDAFEQIPQLQRGGGVSDFLKQKFTKLHHKLPPTAVTSAELKNTLQTMPHLPHFPLSHARFTSQYHEFPVHVSEHLQKCLAEIKRLGTSNIARREDSPLRKLLSLARLSNLDDIVDLLATDDAPQIITQINNFLSQHKHEYSA